MITTTAYAHSSRESMFEIGEKLGLTGEALSMFSFALTEVAFVLEVDEKTGVAKIVEVDGRKVQ